MQYKRNEYFRYTFGEPSEATFRIIKQINNESGIELSKKGKCYIVDVSPNGVRMLTDLSINIEQLKKIELNFVLDEQPITMIGDLVWSQKKIHGIEYGVRLNGDHDSEQLIVNELKTRRKKEMDQSSPGRHNTTKNK